MWRQIAHSSPHSSSRAMHPFYLHPSVFLVAEGWQTDLWFFLPFTLFPSFQHPYPSVANLAETWFCGCVTFPHSSSNAFHPYLHPSVANLTEIWQRCGRWICHFSWSPLHFPPVEVHSKVKPFSIQMVNFCWMCFLLHSPDSIGPPILKCIAKVRGHNCVKP